MSMDSEKFSAAIGSQGGHIPVTQKVIKRSASKACMLHVERHSVHSVRNCGCLT